MGPSRYVEGAARFLANLENVQELGVLLITAQPPGRHEEKSFRIFCIIAIFRMKVIVPRYWVIEFWLDSQTDKKTFI